jgi:hypothetical protein
VNTVAITAIQAQAAQPGPTAATPSASPTSTSTSKAPTQ